MRASQFRRPLIDAVLDRLPPLEGQSVRLEFRPALTASRGQLYSHSMSGEPVHAGTPIRKRHIILDEWLAQHPRELRRILTHEIFHFAWARLGNVRRNGFTDLIRIEFVLRARGELGWSTEYRKLALIELGVGQRRPRGSIQNARWRDYICEMAAVYLLAVHRPGNAARRVRPRPLPDGRGSAIVPGLRIATQQCYRAVTVRERFSAPRRWYNSLSQGSCPMKSVFVLLCCAGLWAQTPAVPPPPLPPPAFSNPQAAAPVAPASVPPDTVVAEVDGKKYTAAEVNKLMQSFPPQMIQAVRSNPQQALSYLLMMGHLAAEAEKAKLDQNSPLKETLEYQRMNALAQAQINQVKNYQFNPSPEDEEKYYKAHPDKYEEAKLKVIYVAFSANPAANANTADKKPLTETEAKAKIEDLRKKLAAGGDFAQLAKENSDDKDSAAKGGDFPSLKRTSAYPDAIKQAIFALKPGEISEPIRQPNGFYLLRLEQKRVQPFDEVRVQIYEEMKNADFSNWMQALQKRYEVKVENPGYFASKPAPPPAH